MYIIFTQKISNNILEIQNNYLIKRLVHFSSKLKKMKKWRIYYYGKLIKKYKKIHSVDEFTYMRFILKSG